MRSTYNGVQYFDSGPHRFIIGETGRIILPPFAGSNALPIWSDEGQQTLRITQRGRLIDDDEDGLWEQFRAIQTEAESDTIADLVDAGGQVWEDMRMVSVTATGPVDRGRVVSIGYEIEYIGII